MCIRPNYPHHVIVSHDIHVLIRPLFKHVKEPGSNVTDNQNLLQPWKPGSNVTRNRDNPGVTHAVTHTRDSHNADIWLLQIRPNDEEKCNHSGFTKFYK